VKYRAGIREGIYIRTLIGIGWISSLLGTSNIPVLKPGESTRSGSCHEAAETQQRSLLERKIKPKPSHQRHRPRPSVHGSHKGTASLQQQMVSLHIYHHSYHPLVAESRSHFWINCATRHNTLQGPVAFFLGGWHIAFVFRDPISGQNGSHG
jgi:hypothetical protein